MKIPFCLDENWKFLSPTEVIADGIPIEVSSNNDKGLVLFIQFGIRGLTIELSDYNDQKHTLKGYYTFHDVNLSDSVTFQIQQDANKWIGFPQGYHSVMVWEIVKV